nr:MAG: replication associated protein [ssDNA virus sp.]
MRYIGTISFQEWSLRAVVHVLKKLDLHECILGEEVGNGGYRHIQYCVDCAGDLEQYADSNILGWHVEKCISWDESIRYCRKEGRYHYFGNSIEEREFRRIRIRENNDFQKSILDSVQNQNDRSITVWIDRVGGQGKSTLLYLMERAGQWFAIPRTELSANRMNDFVAMHYKNEEVIVLDIPRAQELTEEQAFVLEDIKDGLIKSAKYQGTTRFIKGVKVLVYTNQWVPNKTYKMLTEDRWDIHANTEKGIYKVERGGNKEYRE